VKTDYELAQRLQAEEQKELTIEEKSKLFQQLLEKRKKHIVAKRAEEKRNRPPTKAQQRSIMCTYLKNMDGWKPKYLKNKSFANIQELFEKAMKRVNTFVDFRTELVEGTKKEEGTKKAEEEMIEGSSIRVGDELEQEMLKSFDREDLETLWKLVKDKHGSTRPEEGYERVLWGDLKTMFQSLHVFMLVEKRYPLTPATITEMLNKKLQADHWNEMGGLLGLNDFLMLLKVTVAHIEVTAAKLVLLVSTASLMMLVYKLLLLVFRVNATGTKLQLLKG
ncbi:hypothetical protein Tco_1481648, partial [Tanacetum coccineum]